MIAEEEKMSQSTQHKLGNTRPPRVQITYDVLVGGEKEHKELPFVLGIMADLSGMRSTEPLPIKDRSFVGIDMDNFNDIMAHIAPNLDVSVSNKLLNNQGKFKASLLFESMEDFQPNSLIEQIPTLSSLNQSRLNLKDLLSKMDGNDELEQLLSEIMLDPKKQEQLSREIDEELGIVKKKSPKPDFDDPEYIAQQTLRELPPVMSSMVEEPNPVSFEGYEKTTSISEETNEQSDKSKKDSDQNDSFFSS